MAAMERPMAPQEEEEELGFEAGPLLQTQRPRRGITTAGRVAVGTVLVLLAVIVVFGSSPADSAGSRADSSAEVVRYFSLPTMADLGERLHTAFPFLPQQEESGEYMQPGYQQPATPSYQQPAQPYNPYPASGTNQMAPAVATSAAPAAPAMGYGAQPLPEPQAEPTSPPAVPAVATGQIGIGNGGGDMAQPGVVAGGATLGSVKPAPAGQCATAAACLTIVDQFLDAQPRAFELLQARSDAKLENDLPGPCPEGPAKCRHDTYDSALAAIYYTKRGNHPQAKRILDAFIKALYPAPGATFKPAKIATAGKYTGIASGRQLTLLASSYNSQNPPTAGNYEAPQVTDGGVDTGNNAWAALAFGHYAAATQQACYGVVARDIAGALVQASKCTDALMGYTGHLEPYPGNYRSSEHNIDMHGLGKVINNQEISTNAATFVSGMYGKNPSFPSTYATGTADAQHCDPMVAPGFPVAVDATFWNILADADADQARLTSALDFALQSPGQDPGHPGHPDTNGLWVTDTDSQRPDLVVSGLRFSTKGNGVQWENTAGAVMAMAHFQNKFGVTKYSEYIESARGSIKALLQAYNGVPSSVLGGTYVAWQSYSNGENANPPGGTDTGFGWPYLRYTAAASTAWAGLMLLFQADASVPVNENANPYAAPQPAMPMGNDATCLR